MKTNTRYTYSYTARLLHWGMAVIFIGMLGVGWYMGGAEAPFKWKLYGLHKSFGITLMVFVVFRLFWRFSHKPPHVSDSYCLNILSSIGVVLLYMCMLAMIMSGYIMSDAGGHQIDWFGVMKIPFLLEKNNALSGFARNIHGIVAFGFTALISVHILAALYHHFARKDRVLKSMMGR